MVSSCLHMCLRVGVDLLLISQKPNRQQRLALLIINNTTTQFKLGRRTVVCANIVFIARRDVKMIFHRIFLSRTRFFFVFVTPISENIRYYNPYAWYVLYAIWAGLAIASPSNLVVLSPLFL